MAESNALVIPKRVSMQYDNALATMSQEDKDRYLSMASSITPTDIGSIQSFGTEANGVLTETSNRLIQANANNLGDEVRDLVTSLVVEMKGIDVGELNAESKVKRFMRNLPFGLGKKTERDLIAQGYSKKEARKHKGEEKSGHDCAKWLIDYCIDHNLNLPAYSSQSANPVGRENLLSILDQYKSVCQ